MSSKGDKDRPMSGKKTKFIGGMLDGQEEEVPLREFIEVAGDRGVVEVYRYNLKSGEAHYIPGRDWNWITRMIDDIRA